MSAKKLIPAVGFFKEQESALDITINDSKKTTHDAIQDSESFIKECTIQCTTQGIIQNTREDAIQVTSEITNIVTEQNREQDPIKGIEQITTKDATKFTFQIPLKHEPFSKRLVANVTPSQKVFVQKMSKKFENESAFIRFMLDRFMNDIDFR